MATGGTFGAIKDAAKAGRVLSEIAKRTAKNAAKKAGGGAPDLKKERDIDENVSKGRESVDKGKDKSKYPPDWSEKGKTKNSTSTYNSEIKGRLRQGPLRFVVANVGRPLQWIEEANVFQYWKNHVINNLVEPKDGSARFSLDDFPNEFAYTASEWKGALYQVVLLEMHH